MAEHLRKRVSIMFTDIYGYSRLMSENEDEALALLSVHDTIIEKAILRFKGSILKKMGDAYFAEFSSSVSSLQCAILIQEKLQAYNREKAPGELLLVRIGLHEGDVIVKDQDLFGNGVNVAARLEPLADPGGICISEQLYLSVEKEVNVNVFRIADVELKNILEKHTIYKIPSPYGDIFTEKEVPENKTKHQYQYRIKRIDELPPQYISPIELMVFTLIFCIIVIGVLGFQTMGRFEIDVYWFMLKQQYSIIIPIIAFLLITVTYFYSSKRVRIIFKDIRDVDKVLDFITSQIGYKSIRKTNNHIVFKPSLYNYIMYSARKITAHIDGHSIVFSGNFMYIRKLVKMMRRFDRDA